MSYTSPPRQGEGPLPDFRFVPKADPRPGAYGSTSGCYGCAFHKQAAVPKHLQVRCSRVSCHVGPNKNMVAELVQR